MRTLPLLSMCILISLSAQAQTSDDDDFEAFRKSIHKDFESFRSKINKEFAEFLRNPWKEMEETKPVPKPKEEPVPPVVMPEDDKDKQQESKPVVIEEVVKPQPPKPQPKPVEPIEEVPMPVEKTFAFTFFGTSAKVRFDTANKITLRGVDPNSVSNAISTLSDGAYDNMIIDCLNIRKDNSLCDWAYLQMLKTVAEAVYGKSTNEAALLTGYLYLQSGYKMRFASADGKLYVLYATPHVVYDCDTYTLDGVRYCGLEELPARLSIADAAFPKEQTMSLYVPKAQQFANRMSSSRTITSKRYPDMKGTVRINQNLMDFYSTYPTSMIGDNFVTRWAMYANTPMQQSVKDELYPALRQAISGCGQLTAVNKLLNWVQTGFVYEYDDKVWGGDRAFFAEESLNYPYCDCEDRSILFTRLVRDLLGLKCILIYYPGHLASAVQFTESVSGDYIMLSGRKYIVTDPTYIGASVGMTMPNMNNQTAKVILLE